MYWSPSTIWSNAASQSQRRLNAYLRNSMCQQLLNHLAVLHVHTDGLYSIDIDVIAREFVAKSENRLATFGCIWIALHFVPELAASHNRTFNETELRLVLCLYAILQHLPGTRCMQSMNIYIVKPILCFWSKNVRTGCKRQGQRMGRGEVGWQHACAMQMNMARLNFFSIVAPVDGNRMIWQSICGAG